ncbi:MAG: hypothetical protein ABFC84_16595 [Veillonellales bacterium]
MRVVKVYVCPVCQGRYDSREEAEKCRSKHQIQELEICCCETCGAGWYVNHWGVGGAVKLAKECEQQHKVDGTEAETATRTFFLSGGAFGHVRCIKSKNMEFNQSKQAMKS